MSGQQLGNHGHGLVIGTHAVQIPQRHVRGRVLVGGDGSAGRVGAKGLRKRVRFRQEERPLVGRPVGVGQLWVTQNGVAEILAKGETGRGGLDRRGDRGRQRQQQPQPGQGG